MKLPLNWSIAYYPASTAHTRTHSNRQRAVPAAFPKRISSLPQRQLTTCIGSVRGGYGAVFLIKFRMRFRRFTVRKGSVTERMSRASQLPSPMPPAVACATVAAPILGALSNTAVNVAATVFPLQASPPARVSPWLSFIGDGDPGVRSWRDLFSRVGRPSPACVPLEAAFNMEINTQLRVLRLTFTATAFVAFAVQVFTVPITQTWAIPGSIAMGIIFMVQFALPAWGSAMFSLTIMCISGAHVRVRGVGCRVSRPSDDAVAREPQRCSTGASTPG